MPISLKRIGNGSSITNALIWLSILLASCDIVFKFEIKGLTVRATQLFSLVVMVCLLLRFIKYGSIKIYKPIVNMLIVFCFNTVFILNSRTAFNAIGYDLWLLLDIIQILAFSYYLSTQETIASIIRKYIICFDAFAVLGLLQWLLQFFNINFFIMQISAMHRSNGFSYEPSFYATYMLMGAIVCLYLVEKRNYRSMNSVFLYVSTLLIVAALILSTSRMGLLVLAIYMVFRGVVCLNSYIRMRASWVKLLFTLMPILAGLGVIAVIIALELEVEFVLTYFNGLGIGGTASHSADIRMSSTQDTWNLFLSSPFIGCSLGGIDAAILHSKLIGYTTAGNGSASMSVALEALCAYGVFGAFFFFKYIYDLSFGSFLKLKKHKGDNKDREMVNAMILAFVFEFGILQFNQNILRPPFWVHIALLTTVIQMFLRDKEEETVDGN
ncbi:MAG: O-antigen ligase family protein [Saccharofermentans sp.]|nr:O-antigen ligase family protein [Saccharofermentans sp.]